MILFVFLFNNHFPIFGYCLCILFSDDMGKVPFFLLPQPKLVDFSRIFFYNLQTFASHFKMNFQFCPFQFHEYLWIFLSFYQICRVSYQKFQFFLTLFLMFCRISPIFQSLQRRSLQILSLHNLRKFLMEKSLHIYKRWLKNSNFLSLQTFFSHFFYNLKCFLCFKYPTVLQTFSHFLKCIDLFYSFNIPSLSFSQILQTFPYFSKFIDFFCFLKVVDFFTFFKSCRLSYIF